MYQGKRILVTGGTGSLGRTLVRRFLSEKEGLPAKVIVFSRDEAKQHDMRMSYKHVREATEEIIFRNSQEILEFRIGDVRSYESLADALRNIDIVFHAAAMKQVPTCEYFPFEGVETNIAGTENIIRAISQLDRPVETVVGISTDKACKPVNVMGMTKAIQERMLVQANMRCPGTRFVCARYGNVLMSRGSVLPLFLSQIASGGPVTITTKDMTRFLLTLDESVDLILAALQSARPGETYVPRIPSVRVEDLAHFLIDGRDISVTFTGIRPGEKTHEILVSEEEVYRTIEGVGNYLAITPMLPELSPGELEKPILQREYSSADVVMTPESMAEYLGSRLSNEERLAMENRPVSSSAV